MDKRADDSSQTKSPKVDESHSSHLNHHDYKVGWICALPKEQTAATAMLDHVHPNLPKSPHDQNTYTLGRMGKHNVVIACLPKGQYATIPAAKVATWMIGTFPSIRVGLMVGIGGGVPPKVRLGDVVVSTPTAEYPGVVQWDLGKAEGLGHFKRTGSLNNPPTVLLTALAKLETQYDIYGSQIPRYLADMAMRHPRLVPKYTWSKSLRDPVASWDCHDTTQGEIRVQFGLIASGNQVIKDASVRDRLNERLGGNVLCVEMEAAGLMNDFPCIVVRGICDYADSRKNKEWQEYAAAVAAGCAKELLEITDPMDINHTPEARAVVHER